MLDKETRGGMRTGAGRKLAPDKKKTKSIRLSPGVAEQLEKEANQSELIEKLLAAHFKEKEKVKENTTDTV